MAETVDTNSFKNGMHIELDGKVWRIVEFQHVKPGKGGAFVRTRLKSLDAGAHWQRSTARGLPTASCAIRQVSAADARNAWAVAQVGGSTSLYETHDGGRHWHALPKVARPEIDFGEWADADVYPYGTAFVLLSNGGSEKRRLLETTDAGHTWRVVHRWR